MKFSLGATTIFVFRSKMECQGQHLELQQVMEFKLEAMTKGVWVSQFSCNMGRRGWILDRLVGQQKEGLKKQKPKPQVGFGFLEWCLIQMADTSLTMGKWGGAFMGAGYSNQSFIPSTQCMQFYILGYNDLSLFSCSC